VLPTHTPSNKTASKEDTVMSNTIYLYLKTHNKTGLKYLGKTAQDPFEYRGSGKYWSSHLEKHGDDVTTEVLFETTDAEELKRVGLEYSEKWNIVESREFANLVLEQGDGGNRSSFIDYGKVSKSNTGKKMSNEAITKAHQSRKQGAGWGQSKGIIQNDDWKEKRLQSLIKRGFDYNRDPEITKQKVGTRMKNGSYHQSEESKRKISEKMKKVWAERKAERIKNDAKQGK